MEDCKIKYTREHFEAVAARLNRNLRRGNFDLSWLSETFSDSDVIMLTNAIDNLLGTRSDEEIQRARGILLGDLPEIEGAFGPQFLANANPATADSNTIVVENIPKHEQRTALSSVRGAFLANNQIKNPTEQYSKTIADFRKRIVETALYDTVAHRLRNPNFVNAVTNLDTINSAIFEYRKELAKKLWNALYIGQPFPMDYDMTDIEMTAFINKVLSAYQTRRSEADPNSTLFGTYMVLRNFDSLLDSEFKGLFKIKTRYKNNNRLAPDMYEYTGGTVDVVSKYGDEYADAESYSGKFIKVMLDYLQTPHGRTIGFGTFCNLMSQVREWAETEGSAYLTTATDENGNPLSAQDIVFGDNNADWGSLIYAFIDKNNIKLTTDEYESLQVIANELMKSPDLDLRSLFVNQAKKSVKYRYLVVVPKYNTRTRRMEMTTVELSDRVIDKQNFNVQKSVQNSVFKLRSTPNLRERLLNENHITVEPSGTKTIVTFNGITNTTVPGKTNNVSYEITEKDNKLVITRQNDIYDEINTDAVAKIVRQFVGVPLPTDIDAFIKQVSGELGAGDLLSIYAEPIIHVIMASDPNYKEIDDSKLKEKRVYPFKNGILNTYKYFADFEPAARLSAKLYSTTDNNVIRNEAGNALPGYQITSAVYEVKQYIYDIQHGSKLRSGLNHDITKVSDIHDANPLVRKHTNPSTKEDESISPIGRIFTRGAITRNGYSRESNQLSSKEVFHTELVGNFLKRLQAGQSIILQPITYSDKKTHFLIEYNIDHMWSRSDVRGKATKRSRKYSDIIRDLTDSDSTTRDLAKIDIVDEIREVRADRTKRQILNVLNRFNKVYNLWTGNLTYSTSNETLKDCIDKVRQKLDTFTDIKQLRADFGHNVDLNEALDISTWKEGKIQKFDLNYTLLQEVENYILDDIAFKEYMNQQRVMFAKRLARHKFQFDGLFDSSLRDIIATWKSNFGKDASKWVDETGLTMKTFRVFDSKGNEIEDSQNRVDEVFDGDVTVELHPIIEAYMLSDALLSNSFNDVLFGATNGFSDKGIGNWETLRTIDARHQQNVKAIKSKNLSKNIERLQLASEDARYRREKAKRFALATGSRLGDEFKRTVIGGAIRTSYAQGLKYGISSKWKMAVVQRTKAGAYNYKGDAENVDVHDGSGRVSAIVARQENVSLKDAQQSGNIRKTIINYNDPETGTLYEIKWAENVLTNADRRSSPDHSDYSAEIEHKKMHSVKEIETEKLLDIDFKRYYNPNGNPQIDGNKVITHTSELYYKNRLNRKYYKILSIDSDVDQFGNVYAIINEAETDKFGTIIGATKSRQQYLHTIYDLDQVFGGAYCMELNEETGKLQYAETNNDIVYNIVCDNDLKDYMIAFVIDDTAIKVGATNVNNNDIFSRTNADELKYFEIETKYAGLQMNADHEIEESEVSLMGQMVSALIQGGFQKGTVDYVYRTIGQIALKNIRTYQNIVDSGDENALYMKLGKLFASAFVSGRRDSISLAEAFITNAAEALRLGRSDNKIPFSSNQIKGIFQSTVTSTLNRLGIRMKFPGLGGINAPAFGVRQVYKLGDNFTDADEIEDYIYEDLEKRKASGEISRVWGIGNIFWQQRSSMLGTELDNPYIRRLLDLNELLPEDTIVIREANIDGTVKEPQKDGKVIRIRDLKTLDQYKNLYIKNGDLFEAHDDQTNTSRYFQIYKWDYQPMELMQSQDEVSWTDGIRNGKIYWNDLDSVRAAHYIVDYSFDNPFNSKIDAVIRSVIQDNSELVWDPTFWSELKKSDPSRFKKEYPETIRKILNYCNSKTQEFARNLEENGSLEVATPFAVSKYTDTKKIRIHSYKKHTAKIVMGKSNATLLGFEPGDRIRDVMTQKERFFRDRLANKFSFPDQEEIDPALYDAVLFNQDGSKTLVVLSYVDSKYDRLEGATLNSDYVINSDNNFEKNDQELYSANGKSFYKSKDGKYDILVVNNRDALDEVLRSKNQVFYRFNYNLENWKAIEAYKDPNNFVVRGASIITLVDYSYKNSDGKTITISKNQIDSLKPYELYDLVQVLQLQEATRSGQRIEKLAEKRYQAFKAQLNYILTRIPAQSMQSFMDVEVAVYTDSVLNEVYVPRALQWIQGSDYDIDKDYMMGFGLAPDGTLPTLSDLEEDFDPMDVLLLEAPQGRKFEKLKSRSGINRAQYEAIFGNGVQDGDITKLNDILQSKSKLIQYIPIEYSANGLTENEIQHLLNVIDKHEKSKRQGNIEKLALQNTVVRGILKILKSPSTQINMGNPISMREMQDISKTSTLSRDELTMTLDVPFVKFDMQEQNMVGREVIGIGAVSLKHYFAASAYLNSRVSVIETVLATNQDYRNLIEPLLDLCFNRKLGDHEIITLGNLDFRRVKKLIGNRNILVNIDVDKYKNDGNSYLFETFVKDGVLDVTGLINHLDKQANGTSTDPVDVAFALSQLISAATDNAKELILAKINATTKLADMYTYLLTTGMSFKQIAEIMMSPEFNIVVEYAQDDIYDLLTSGTNLENALNFVLDKKALPKDYKFNGFFNNILTEIDDNTAFLPTLNAKTDVLRRFYDLTHDNTLASDKEVIDHAKNVIRNKFIDNKISTEYNELVDFIYSELRTNKDAQDTLLDVLRKRLSSEQGYLTIDPDVLAEYGVAEQELDPDDIYVDADLDTPMSGEGYSVESKGWHDMSDADVMYVYRYVKDYLIPKNQKIQNILTEERRRRLEDILTNVLPAMQEQQIHGQLLGVNKGLLTDDYGEVNFIRKVENFINRRYRTLQDDTVEAFDFIRFLSDKPDRNGKYVYRDQQIANYEKVKSTINILKSILSVPHYTSMFTVVRLNRAMISRSAALQIERDLTKQVLGADKPGGKVPYGSTLKMNAKEFKELQRVVSDSLIASFILSLGRSITIKEGYKYYDDDGSEKTVLSSTQDKPISNLHGLASFKRWMDDYVIPTLITLYPDNRFVMNLTTGIKQDTFSKRPYIFYKPSFNLSDVSRSPKLELLYEGVASDFALLFNERFENSDWTIGDLFYLYNLMVNKDSIGGDSFSRLFEEMATSRDRFSIIYQFNDWLSRLDNGDLRWKGDPTLGTEGKNTIIHFGDAVAINLSDIRYRCSVNEASDYKFGITRIYDENGNIKEVALTENKENKIDLNKATRSDYVLNLPFSAKANFVPGKAVPIESKSVSLTSNPNEIVRAVIDFIKDELGTSVPIHYVSSDEIKKIIKKDPSNEMLNAQGFVYNGEIFVNTSTIDFSTPIHELMHLVCAAMKYGSADQRSLYYALLDSIIFDENDPRWGEFYKIVKPVYSWAKGSDFREEILVRALAHEFETGFNTLWKDREVDVANVQRVVTNILENLFMIKVTGERQIAELANGSLGEVLSVFRSQFIGEDTNKIVRTVMPDNQRLAAFKSRMWDTILTSNGKC